MDPEFDDVVAVEDLMVRPRPPSAGGHAPFFGSHAHPPWTPRVSRPPATPLLRPRNRAGLATPTRPHVATPSVPWSGATRPSASRGRAAPGEWGGLTWGLVRSRYREDTARGVALLSELLPETPPEEQRDVLFYLALGCYRLKEYERALEHLERLLAAEPQNAQVLRLRSRVRSRLRRDGLVGAAIVGGVVMGVAGLLGVAIARSRH
ncbi:mitochondrial fission 1 protein [Camarhynchus parvulus]|uniref:mitochondrial fission 1 protein n=1 Tax=Geospiza parvula TaxID=87175 RepID=UPI001237F8BB|nr:mitochondrial fission 1 protein [Camarhynchus parvulus]